MEEVFKSWSPRGLHPILEGRRSSLSDESGPASQEDTDPDENWDSKHMVEQPGFEPDKLQAGVQFMELWSGPAESDHSDHDGFSLRMGGGVSPNFDNSSAGNITDDNISAASGSPITKLMPRGSLTSPSATDRLNEAADFEDEINIPVGRTLNWSNGPLRGVSPNNRYHRLAGSFTEPDEPDEGNTPHRLSRLREAPPSPHIFPHSLPSPSSNNSNMSASSNSNLNSYSNSLHPPQRLFHIQDFRASPSLSSKHQSPSSSGVFFPASQTDFADFSLTMPTSTPNSPQPIKALLDGNPGLSYVQSFDRSLPLSDRQASPFELSPQSRSPGPTGTLFEGFLFVIGQGSSSEFLEAATWRDVSAPVRAAWQALSSGSSPGSDSDSDSDSDRRFDWMSPLSECGLLLDDDDDDADVVMHGSLSLESRV